MLDEGWFRCNLYYILDIFENPQGSCIFYLKGCKFMKVVDAFTKLIVSYKYNIHLASRRSAMFHDFGANQLRGKMLPMPYGLHTNCQELPDILKKCTTTVVCNSFSP